MSFFLSLRRSYDDYVGRRNPWGSSYRGSAITKAALQLMPLIFQRPGQVRQMLWKQLDLTAAIWRCPGIQVKQTKTRRAQGGGADHIVPLPYQAVEIIKSLQNITGPTELTP